MKTIKYRNQELSISKPEIRVIDYLNKFSIASLDTFQTGSGRYRRTDLPRSASRLNELGIIYHQKERPLSEKAQEYFAENPRRQYVLSDSPRLKEIAKLL